MLPENQLLQGRCSSAVATECCCILLLPVSVSCWSWLSAWTVSWQCLAHLQHAEKLMYQFILWSFSKLILMHLLIHSTLPGYVLLRWRRTALSLDSVLALQISWPLSSRSTSLRVDWKSESDSCHLLPIRCFFSMFSRESSILQWSANKSKSQLGTESFLQKCCVNNQFIVIKQSDCSYCVCLVCVCTYACCVQLRTM